MLLDAATIAIPTWIVPVTLTVVIALLGVGAAMIRALTRLEVQGERTETEVTRQRESIHDLRGQVQDLALQLAAVRARDHA